MKKTLKGYVMGFLSASLLVTGIGYAANTTTLYDVLVEGVKIVVDGQKINPTDANGNSVEPIIYNGTTYLPVRAVANALGKAVYWDGPNYTVYLGNMDGKLEYPTVMLKDLTSISNRPQITSKLTDNYGNNYGSAFYNKDDNYQYLLNMKYSRFKGKLYVPEGVISDSSCNVIITVDGKEVYRSPLMTKTSQPVSFDVNVTGGNDFIISFSEQTGMYNDDGVNRMVICLADAGFYQ